MRTVLRIASAEASRHVRFFDRKVLLAALAVGLILGLAWPAVQDRGVHPEAGLYVVAVDGPTPLEPVLDGDPAFLKQHVDGTFDASQVDLLIRDQEVSYDPTSDKSVTALNQLEVATKRWLNERMADEEDSEAAFPVAINVVYQKRSVIASPGGGASGPQPGPSPGPGDGGTPPGPPGNGTTQTNGSNATGPGQAPINTTPIGSELVHQQGTTQTGLTPDQLDPPFPLDSLLLTFAYLIPLTFISELYSGSIFGEKVRSRGIMLLSGPVTGGQVLLGKSLPYIGLMAVIAAGVTVAIGSNLVGLLAVVPIVAFVLASSLFLSIVSRSQRALTFLLVSTNVAVSTFLFLPALFTQIEPVAFLSPVSVIAATIRGDPVGLGPFLYATVPLALAAGTLAYLASSIYKAETLFTPGGIFTRVVDAVHGVTGSKRALLVAGALAVPFAFGLELFVLVFAVTLDLTTAFVVFLVGSAIVEETLKALPGYASFNRPGSQKRTPWTIGGLVGLGFFLGEKGALAFTLLGFGLLPKGDAALLTFGIASTPLLVLAPLVLHIGTTTLSAFGARRGKRSAIWGWAAAVAVHAAYNMSIVLFNLGGGFP